MKVFISWSLSRSRYIAEQLHWWIPNVLQAVEPFISTQDIDKGTRGNVVISEQLEEANVGIIVLTPENLKQEWILFEAGALSKQKNAYVWTMLYDLAWTDVPQPLGQFQHTRFAKDDLIALVKTIHKQLPVERQLKPERLTAAINTWLPQLEESLKNVPPPKEDEPKVKPPDQGEQMKELITMVRGLVNQRPPDLQTVYQYSKMFPPGALVGEFEKTLGLPRRSSKAENEKTVLARFLTGKSDDDDRAYLQAKAIVLKAEDGSWGVTPYGSSLMEEMGIRSPS